MNRRSLINTLTGGAVATAAIASAETIPTTPGMINLDNSEKLRLMELARYIACDRNSKTIFSIGVGNLPKAKADQFLRDVRAQCSPKTGLANDYFISQRTEGTSVTKIEGAASLEEITAVYQELLKTMG